MRQLVVETDAVYDLPIQGCIARDASVLTARHRSRNTRKRNSSSMSASVAFVSATPFLQASRTQPCRRRSVVDGSKVSGLTFSKGLPQNGIDKLCLACPPAPPGRACHIGPPNRQRPRSSCEKKTAPGMEASRQGPNLDFKSMCPYPRRQSLRLLCVKVRAPNKLSRLHLRPFHAHLRSKQPLSSQPLSAAHTGFMAVRQTPVLGARA